MYLLIYNNIQEVVGPRRAGELRIWPSSKCTSQEEMPLQLCPPKSLLLFFNMCFLLFKLDYLKEGGLL